MAVVGFNFTKMLAEKEGQLSGKVSINNNIGITEAKSVDVNLGAKGSTGLLVSFDYSCNYDPKLGKISLSGNVIDVEDEADVKKNIESWKKNKTLSKEVMQRIMSYVLNKCTIQSIVLSRDISLPAPVPLPKIEPDKVKKK